MHERKKRIRFPWTLVLLALPVVLSVASGCAEGVGRDVALSSRARAAVMSTCGGDMVDEVTADRSGLVLVRLNVTAKDASVARAIAGVAAGIVFEGVPETQRVAVRDSAGAAIATYSRPRGPRVRASEPCPTFPPRGSG